MDHVVGNICVGEENCIHFIRTRDGTISFNNGFKTPERITADEGLSNFINTVFETLRACASREKLPDQQYVESLPDDLTINVVAAIDGEEVHMHIFKGDGAFSASAYKIVHLEIACDVGSLVVDAAAILNPVTARSEPL